MDTQPDTNFLKGIGAPATPALIAAGYTMIEQLANVPIAELSRLHGVGPKALNRLQESLAEKGLALGSVNMNVRRSSDA
jgi:hypothetical protein